MVVASSLGVAVMAASFACSSWQPPPPPPPFHSAQPGTSSGELIVPASLGLGTVRVGETAEAEFRIVNRSTQSVHVARFESGCPCVGVRPPTITIPAGGEAVAEVVFDSSGEPDFRGELAVRLDAFDIDASPLFHTKVAVGVTDSNR